MISVKYFFACERIQPEINPLMPNTATSMHMVNPFVAIVVPLIPTAFSFTVCFAVAGLAENEGHKLALEIIDSNKMGVARSEVEFFQPSGGGSMGQPDGYAQIAIELRNVVLRVEGEYEFILSHGGETVYSYKLDAVVVKGMESQ